MPSRQVVNVAEGTGLLAIAPHLDLVVAGQLGNRDLAGQGGRCFFAPAIPGPLRPEDVVEAHDAGLKTIILAIVGAQAFHDQFFPAIGILRHGRVGVFFLQRDHIGLRLLVFGVNTGRGSIEVALHTVDPGRFQGMGIDQRVVMQDLGVMGGDEAHPAHIRSQAVDLVNAAGCLQAVIPAAQVEQFEFVRIRFR